jgi:hypothetical protein
MCTSLSTLSYISLSLGGRQVLALFCEMTTNSNPELIQFQQTVDELETFMRDHDLPDMMRRELREYFHQRKHVRMSERAFSVTQQMSTKLQAKVIGLIYGSWLSHIPFLRGCESACVTQLAMAMRPNTFAPSESPPLKHLYVVKRGLVAYGMQLKNAGKYPASHSPRTPTLHPCTLLTVACALCLLQASIGATRSSPSLCRSRTSRAASPTSTPLRSLKRTCGGRSTNTPSPSTHGHSSHATHTQCPCTPTRPPFIRAIHECSVYTDGCALSVCESDADTWCAE